VDHRFAVAAFVLCALFASCGGDHSGDRPVGVPRTGGFEMTIVADEPSGPVTLRATGTFDVDRDAYSLVTDLGELVPGLGARFAIIATPDVVFVDCPYLTRLLSASTRWISVRGAGGERVRSWVIDPLQMVAAGEGGDGLVRGSTMRFADGSDEGSVLVSMRYFDVGTPVVIDPPAADQVTDETDAIKRLFGGTTGG
jgi:hypothetical protein